LDVVIFFKQKFGNVNQTGVLDKDTKELLKKPRCGKIKLFNGFYFFLSIKICFKGNPDFDEPPTIENGRNRHKRYILGPTKWGKKEITWA
jgi:hypothetical protein